MHRVLVLGAGKIGSLISGLLAESGSYTVHLADVDPHLQGVRTNGGARPRIAQPRLGVLALGLGERPVVDHNLIR